MQFLSSFFKYLFSRKNTFWFLVMIILTIIISASGLDAWWLSHLGNTAVSRFFGLAGIVGFFVPAFLVGMLVIAGFVIGSQRMRRAGGMVAIAGMLGLFLSSFLKFFTGRVAPYGDSVQLLHLSQTFQIGFGKGGVFWGWPSSHTTVAFAMSVVLAVYYRDKKWVGIIAILYAFYIGLGASMSFHWLGDVVAGMILGSIIGVGIAQSYQKTVKQ